MPSTTSIRRCGGCKCPGHTKPKCYVYDPNYQAWEEPWVAPAMNARARQQEHARIAANGLTHKEITKVNYLKDWIARKGTAGLYHWEVRMAEQHSISVQEKDHIDTLHDEEVNQEWRAIRLQTTYHPRTPTAPPPPAPVPIPEPVLPPQAEKVIEEDSCPICMEAFTDVNHCVGRCGHQFHTACLFKACGAGFAQNNKCPTCRQQLF